MSFQVMHVSHRLFACVLQSLGCDYVIDSNAVLDRCGVCNGNDSTCETVRRTFEDSEGLGMCYSFGSASFCQMNACTPVPSQCIPDSF